MLDDEQASLEEVVSGPRVNVEVIVGQVGDKDIGSHQTRKPPGEARAAAAQVWLSTLNERGRWMALRYTAGNVGVEAQSSATAQFLSKPFWRFF